MEDNKEAACGMVLSFTVLEKMISCVVMTRAIFYRHILRHTKSQRERNPILCFITKKKEGAP